jgi:cysteine desulfurase/selenocysteine lyase
MITTKQVPFDVKKIRSDFPNLHVNIHGKPLVYLDNAATTFKPQVVIDALTNHYKYETSNVHRGVHYLSEKATAAFEGSRIKVQKFLNASKSSEIIFTGGTTDSINLVAQCYGELLKKGDEIIISEMEHHSNIVPWQLLCERRGCILKIAPMNDNGELIWDKFTQLINAKTKLISIVYVSNSLGTVNPVKKIIDLAHKNNIPVLVDGAQVVTDTAVDVQALDCDFFAFSSHKIFGPTGIGVLYGKEKWLEKMPPYRGGGDMIASVTFEKSTYNVLPYKFEAGTPNIADAIGLGTALDYVTSIGFEGIHKQKQELLEYGTKALLKIDGLKLIGTAKEKTSILSFILPNIHPHDIGTLIDEEGIAIRTGHHCTQPVMKHFKIPATSRASLSIYNTKEELDRLIIALKKVKDIFK